jgi:hypothetical protein
VLPYEEANVVAALAALVAAAVDATVTVEVTYMGTTQVNPAVAN